MFGIFKKKTQEDKLLKKYEKLMKQSHAVSTSNRAESDRIYAEAQELMDQVDALRKEQS